MNSILAAIKANAEKHADALLCVYCKRAFSNHQALGGHLRVHQEEIKSRRSMNSPSSSSNAVGIAGIKPNLLANCQPENSSRGYRKILPLFNGESSPLGFSQRFCSGDTGLVKTGKFFGNNLVNAKPESFMSPNLSSPSGSTVTHYSNYLSSLAIAPSNVAGTTSLNTVAPPATFGCPSDASYSLGTDEACQFNADVFQDWRDDTPFASGNGLQNRQLPDLNKLPYPGFAISHPYPNLGSNQLPGFKESPVGSFPQGPCQCSGQDEAGQSNKNVLACEGNKRPYLGDTSGDDSAMNASKRPKFNSPPPMPTEKPQKKELHLFKDMEHSFSALGISSDAKEEGQVDLDLSLHL